MTSLRLFLALWPPDDVVDRIVRHADDWGWPERARRTRPQQLHVTLHFLGNVPQASLPSLQGGLEVEWEGCELSLDRPAVWPGGIAVVEAGAVPPALARLHSELATCLMELGLPVERRPYRPHVTLARHANGARPPAPEALRWHTGPRYALVRSAGGRYDTLQLFD